MLFFSNHFDHPMYFFVIIMTDESLIKLLLVFTTVVDMRFKDKTIGVQSLKPQLLLGLVIVDQVMRKYGQEAFITSINDGRHSKTSLHYDGGAVDIRSKWFNHPKVILKLCVEAFGECPDFDMILEYAGEEDEHFHLEYQPKRH